MSDDFVPRRARLVAGPAGRVLVVVSTFVAVGYATSAALWADEGPGAGIVGGMLGLTAVSLVRDRHYYRLSLAQRWQVWQVYRTGTPTHDATVDSIALERLRRAERANPRRDQIARWIVGMVIVLLAVVAAVRSGSGWYLLCVAPLGWLIASFFWQRGLPPVYERIRGLSEVVAA